MIILLLKEARLLADKLRNQVAHGQNPQEIKRKALNWCYEQFLVRYLQPQLRTWQEYEVIRAIEARETFAKFKKQISLRLLIPLQTEMRQFWQTVAIHI